MHHDPAGRGLASFRVDGRWLDQGELARAAQQLADNARTVGIVTGFCARHGNVITAETDGPPGALFLAQALDSLGVEVVLVSDRYGLPLLQAGRKSMRLSCVSLAEMPFEADASERQINAREQDRVSLAWCERFFATGPGSRLTQLIAIERPGPSHTLASLRSQSHDGATPDSEFLDSVPLEDQNICHNMRGVSVNEWTAKTHYLFEWIAERRLPITTLGLIDGGNEIGSGSFAWETLTRAIARGPAARVASRIATDFTLIAGVSNWAAYALSLAVVHLHGRHDLAQSWTLDVQRELVGVLISAGAVDGLTLRPEATVDGLNLDEYLDVLDRMLQVCNTVK